MQLFIGAYRHSTSTRPAQRICCMLLQCRHAAMHEFAGRVPQSFKLCSYRAVAAHSFTANMQLMRKQ